MIGETVVDVRRMTSQEMHEEGWDDLPYKANPPAIELSDGSVLYPSRDPEGNGPGDLFGYNEEGAFRVTPTDNGDS